MPHVSALWLDKICDETLGPLVSPLRAPVVTKRRNGKETVRIRKNKIVNLVAARATYRMHARAQELLSKPMKGAKHV